ncbi:acyltransferase domain-containing protein [Actinomadura sp. PM05-2]|uniref:[acyl-carrier-protein] S-malonyltransferase n=1 Tax=Actinomadura parmotrematis TaxID=2864039 RepID=A0ABS7FSQ7_9ACTN|nr:acyltransferase domain-containing protein [Actinomadura parmotrematis]
MGAAWPPDPGPGAVCAFLFAGTGSSGPPDLRRAVAAGGAVEEAVRGALAEVARGVPAGGPDLERVLVDDPASYGAVAGDAGTAQLAAYAASVAVVRGMAAAGVVPGFAVGQSFGEIAALVCAGVFTVAEGAAMAASLVGVLGERGAGGGMGLVLADERAAGELVAAAGEPSVVVACVNAPQATVLAGPQGALERVLAAAREGGVRAVRLAVPYLAHHPAMAGADEEWYKIIRGFRQRPLRMAVHSPVRGRAYRDDDDLHRALADCIVAPVRLPAALRAVHRAGARVFVEAGGGAALCQCARLAIPGARTLAPLEAAAPGGG